MVERWTRDAQGFVKWPDGEWVRYSDYERLRSELSACREALEKASKIVRDVFEGHESGWIVADTDLVPTDVADAFFAEVARAALSPSIQEEGE